ncbi:DJ-1/PfpI family protein [Heliobacillus mobilis]|uniref:DJ-1/PfpI family protein n=1 Tax=Heliobacterium mobile TaxID=28064 RepID=A0A6I3SPB7_HELMO|nr:DJ-1/PfpI family protein [Heliobacterium mobile]MTV50868.1 DJ-1/PfpI family protein [Heliobacterium mobile]
MAQRQIGIFLFDEVEVLDFAGPFEVLSLTTIAGTDIRPFKVKTVSEKGTSISARNGLKIQPDYSFENAPKFDILIVPGGYGAEEIEIHKPNVITWLQKQEERVELICSVCTGAFLLAKAGILDGKKATTHWMDIDRLEAEFPNILVIRDVKYVDEGSVITSSGISAGINMSFYMVQKLLGNEVAQATAKRMEFDITLSCR